MNKIGIVPNPKREINFDIINELINYILSKNITPVIEREMAFKIGLEQYAVTEKTLYSKSDLVVLLGGDGTILRIVKKAMRYNSLLLAINLGHLGFLTDTDKNGMLNSIENVINGNYNIEKRMMIDSTVIKASKAKTFTALNEVCVYMGGIVEAAVYVNDEYIDNFYGDGIIVSTPTGSTAYNLAAGGPILKADSNMIVITPICPHMLHARSIVIGADDIVKISVNSFTNSSLKEVIDGKPVLALDVGDVITIRRSIYSLNIVKTNNIGFYDVLRNKMFGKEGK